MKEKDTDYTSTKDLANSEFLDLLDAGMTSKQLAELAEEQAYYDYDVTDEMELVRALNVKFKIHNNYDFGVQDL